MRFLLPTVSSVKSKLDNYIIIALLLSLSWEILLLLRYC